jgi:hypothetical protein
MRRKGTFQGQLFLDRLENPEAARVPSGPQRQPKSKRQACLASLFSMTSAADDANLIADMEVQQRTSAEPFRHALRHQVRAARA